MQWCSFKSYQYEKVPPPLFLKKGRRELYRSLQQLDLENSALTTSKTFIKGGNKTTFFKSCTLKLNSRQLEKTNAALYSPIYPKWIFFFITEAVQVPGSGLLVYCTAHLTLRKKKDDLKVSNHFLFAVQ